MSAMTISFSELSKNSKRVADAVERIQRVHVRRRDGEDLYLTTARHDEQRAETAAITARLISALVRNDEGVQVVRHALPEVFPWVRHLSGDEVREFVVDIVHATRDAAEIEVHANLHRVIAEWRATARILADPELTAQLTRPLPAEDHGEMVEP